jgi:A/G-specific adenine glycosylase
MQRWPSAPALAEASPAQAIRAWGTLGYPRRATRLHQSAITITSLYKGEVPATYDELITLPGVGDYTANAILAFAYGERATVLDVNVRRVLARAWQGIEFPPAHLSAIERSLAETLVPRTAAKASRWAAASMELGALICTAKNPDCSSCPLTTTCAWHQSGKPATQLQQRKQARYAGSDRQERGRILAHLRQSSMPLTSAMIAKGAANAEQHQRCRDSLLADGLITRVGTRWALPDSSPAGG